MTASASIFVWAYSQAAPLSCTDIGALRRFGARMFRQTRTPPVVTKLIWITDGHWNAKIVQIFCRKNVIAFLLIFVQHGTQGADTVSKSQLLVSCEQIKTLVRLRHSQPPEIAVIATERRKSTKIWSRFNHQGDVASFSFVRFTVLEIAFAQRSTCPHECNQQLDVSLRRRKNCRVEFFLFVLVSHIRHISSSLSPKSHHFAQQLSANSLLQE